MWRTADSRRHEGNIVHWNVKCRTLLLIIHQLIIHVIVGKHTPLKFSMREHLSHVTLNTSSLVDPMLIFTLATLCDFGPTSPKHLGNVLCLLG